MTNEMISGGVALREITRYEGFRPLTWAGDVLYASRGYALFRARVGDAASGKAGPSTTPSLRSGSGRDDNGLVEFERVASFEAPLWRRATSRVRLTGRLVRDGFHALAVHPSGALVGAVPGAIVTCAAGDATFHATHAISRGTRPLNIAVNPAGTFFWGEYFDNAARDQVHVYASSDAGRSWEVAYTFAKGTIRHVHNIVYDRWRECLWILTGDYGDECRILRAKCDLSEVRTVLSGNQQARAVACIPAKEGLYFSTDTPLEQNFICRVSDNSEIARLAPISSSSIYACRTQSGMFFSTMVEPSEVNRDRKVRVYGSSDGETWGAQLEWRKDAWPMKYFQYGNAFLPSGDNATDVLAVTTIAVAGADGVMSLYRASDSVS